MSSFEVHGPFPISFEKRAGGRTLVFDDFWAAGSDAHYLAAECGCYVFAMRASSGLTPVYVGKAGRTFKQEAFNPSNRHKYHNGFSEWGKGTPLMYFVVHPKKKSSKATEKLIKQVEDFLIQAGAAKNPGIMNIRGVQQPKWSIKGVVRSKAGKKRANEVEFAKLFDITAPGAAKKAASKSNTDDA